MDISLGLVDPLDEHRLFEFPRDAACAEALHRRIAPAQNGSRCVLAAPSFYSLAAGVADLRAVNDFLLQHHWPGGPVAAVFGVAEPKYQDEGVVELERLAALGAKGVVWSPRAQGVFADDALVVSLCRRANDLGLKSMVRTAPYSSNEALWRVWRLAQDCAEIPIIVSGALQSWDNAQLIIAAGGGPENLFYDTAGWTVATDPVPIVHVVGETRLLFGTGGLSQSDRAGAELEHRLRTAGLAGEVIATIMTGNAERLLKLKASEE